MNGAVRYEVTIVRTQDQELVWKVILTKEEAAGPWKVTVQDGSGADKLEKIDAAISAQKGHFSGLAFTPGMRYQWNILVRNSEGALIAAAPDKWTARFGILPPRKAEEIRRAALRYAGSPQLLGLAYYQAGLVDEAERLFLSVPDDPSARAWLRELRNRRAALRKL